MARLEVRGERWRENAVADLALAVLTNKTSRTVPSYCHCPANTNIEITN